VSRDDLAIDEARRAAMAARRASRFVTMLIVSTCVPVARQNRRPTAGRTPCSIR